MHVYVRADDLLFTTDVEPAGDHALVTMGDDTLTVRQRPTAAAFLTGLRDYPVRVIAVTDGPQAHVARMLQAVGLLDLIDGVVGARTMTPKTSGPWVLVVPDGDANAADALARRLNLDGDLSNADHLLRVPMWHGGGELGSLADAVRPIIERLGRLAGAAVEPRLPTSPRRPIPTWFFVLVVVRFGHRFLLVEEATSQGWYLPAGRVRAGETLEDAALRETLEESGIPIAIDGVLRVEFTPAAESARCRVVFVAHPIDDTPPRETPTEYSLRARWVTMTEASRHRLRSAEVLSIFKAVEEGATLHPASLIVPAATAW